MSMNSTIESSVARFFSEFLEEQFGEKPGAVTVVRNPPFTVVYLEEFLLPTEKVLINRNELNRVLETRDFLIQTLKPEIMSGLKEISGDDFMGFYADWNVTQETGIFIAVGAQEGASENFKWPKEADEEGIRKVVLMNSSYTQKKPWQLHFYWLNDQLLLIERWGIMVDIEKELIKNGITEDLRLAKRPMEYQMKKLFNLDALLQRHVIELFADWDFELDKGYYVLVMENKNK
ncbi:DUF2294 family protein [Jeotgalibacillus sp. S-D1]|uniref:Na-translocating system protein MpsC family protein n=1 Tax=Jeotgalibacillus sp. S-D1 TaxID=2552189 RepID=UPI00105A1FA3|nr:Na-translocating system protein MpsC family protein [Jeotgalibacillus sp. S-D1]TDL31285.1 DUF2294 family protein [Jeotgalibacillus sp. S-D1]